MTGLNESNNFGFCPCSRCCMSCERESIRVKGHGNSHPGSADFVSSTQLIRRTLTARPSIDHCIGDRLATSSSPLRASCPLPTEEREDQVKHLSCKADSCPFHRLRPRFAVQNEHHVYVIFHNSVDSSACYQPLPAKSRRSHDMHGHLAKTCRPYLR